MFNRLWPVALATVLAGAIGFFFPQVPVVATGFFLLVALLWRRQSSAVAAIEGRDGVEFWFDTHLAARAAAAAAPAGAAADRAGVAGRSAGGRACRMRVELLPRARVRHVLAAVSHARRAVATP